MAIWILLAVYLFLLGSREKKLRAEVQRLARLLENPRRDKPTHGGSDQ